MRGFGWLGAPVCGLLALALWGCEAAPVDREPSQYESAEVPLRRLSHFEYDNAIEDLFLDDARPSSAFPADPEVGGLQNDAKSLGSSPLLSEQYMLAAEGVGRRLAGDPGRLETVVGCDAETWTPGCIEAFIEGVGARAFRRPLQATERTALLESFSLGEEAGGFEEGMIWLCSHLLQSPAFVFRLEYGLEETEGDRSLPLRGEEVAAKLSFFLWASVPDDALLSAAGAGELGSADGIRAHAQRMLDDPRAERALAHAYRSWLGYDDVVGSAKSSERFPEFGDSLATGLAEQTDRLIAGVVLEGDGSLKTLLTAEEAPVDFRVAGLYGVEPPAVVGTWESRTLPDHVGLLTQASVLSVGAGANDTSPVLRGKLVRDALLCQPPQPPPPDADISVPEPDPEATTRERYAQHVEDPACAGCHEQLDPVGFGFEHFDAIGRWRDDENGLPIDATGWVTQTGIGAFDGAGELAVALAEEPQVAACAAQRWLALAHGRALDPSEEIDAQTEQHALEAFVQADWDVRALMLEIVTSDAFRHRSLGEGSP